MSDEDSVSRMWSLDLESWGPILSPKPLDSSMWGLALYGLRTRRVHLGLETHLSGFSMYLAPPMHGGLRV